MEVILLERVEKLGAIGDVVKVKDGFARNYLLPNKKALRANEATASCSRPIARRSKRTTPTSAPTPRKRRRASTARPSS